MRVYVAGPYETGAKSDEDKLQNTKNAIKVGCLLLRDGHEPMVPHLTHFFDLVCEDYLGERLPWEAYMRLDLAWLAAADALIRLPGASRGADMEVARATELGIPVFHSVSDFMTWVVAYQQTPIVR